MTDYSPGFSEEDYLNFRDVFRRLGEQLGRFDANDALEAVAAVRLEIRGSGVPLLNAGDVGIVLHDMTELGYLSDAGRRGENGPLMWEYVEET